MKRRIIMAFVFLGMMSSCNYSLMVRKGNTVKEQKGILLLSDLDLVTIAAGDSIEFIGRDTLMPDVFIPLSNRELDDFISKRHEWQDLLNNKTGAIFVKSDDCNGKVRNMFLQCSDTATLDSYKQGGYYSPTLYMLPVVLSYVANNSMPHHFYLSHKKVQFKSKNKIVEIRIEEGYIKDVSIIPMQIKPHDPPTNWHD